MNYIVAVQTPLPAMRSTSDLLATPLTSGVQPLRQTPTRTLTDSAATSGSLYLGTVSQLPPGKTHRRSINHSTIQRVIDVQAAAGGRDLGSVARDIHKAIAALHDVPKGTKISVRGPDREHADVVRRARARA